MARDSPRAEELDAALAAQAPAIATCIEMAPIWRKSWPEQAAAGFFRRFYQQAKTMQETTVPRFTNL